MMFSSSISGLQRDIFESEEIPLSSWSTVQITNTQHHDVHKFRIYINDVMVYEQLNTDDQIWQNMKLFASDQYYAAANALLRNLHLTTPFQPGKLPYNLQKKLIQS